jgi:hypothetical protein
VAQCIQGALGEVQVHQHDDGSAPGMHDLEIVYPDGHRGAVEVTAAGDAESIELWSLINGRGRWVEPDLIWGWWVAIVPHARAKRLRTDLPRLLRQLEEAGVHEVHAGQWSEGPFEAEAFDLGITHIWQGDSPGTIHSTIDLPIERSSGAVPMTGDPLAKWLSDWILRPEQAYNVEKLARSRLHERHMFVLLPGFPDAPFSVIALLMRDSPPLPTVAPSLPPEVTHPWVMSIWNTGSGMHWSPDLGWEHFDKLTTLTSR